MEVTVRLNKIQREITLDIDVDENAVIAQVTKAGEKKTPLIFTDIEGKVAIIPIESVGYVQCNSGNTRRVGFGF